LVNRELRKMGWVVVRVWEHELKDPYKVAGKISKHVITQKKLCDDM
jgi:G:T-mismatch repair DNA endonuclease (very short patch repair protein)